MTVVVRLARDASERLASWRIREEVFIREQEIGEEIERDGLDEIAWHLVAWEGAAAVGTARVLGIDEAHRLIAPSHARTVKIGRMAVLAAKRRCGIGRALLDAALELGRDHGVRCAELSAQEYVVPFYEGAGFRVAGSSYSEAGIPHRRMLRTLR